MKLITAALITAKAQFNPIHKNKVNPHFKSKYATLDEILEANDSSSRKLRPRIAS